MEAKEPFFKSPFFELNSIGGKRLVAEFEYMVFGNKGYLITSSQENGNRLDTTSHPILSAPSKKCAKESSNVPLNPVESVTATVLG